MIYQTIKVRFKNPVCFIQFNRPEANNTINGRLIEECSQVLSLCEQDSITIIVFEGLADIFCFGADFQEIKNPEGLNPDLMYDLWLKMSNGPFVTVAHVRGKANAGGIGFVAAADIVLADQNAQFSLSELLFGLFPACVLPFLIRRVGFQKAHYLTLTTSSIPVLQAYEWGLVDAYDTDSEYLLRKHLLRLRRLSKAAILRYKQYLNQLNDSLNTSKPPALSANKEIFSDTHNIEGISRYIEEGLFPWEPR